MNVIRGIDTDRGYLCALLCDICCVCITVDYEKKTFTVVVKGKCSNETAVVWSDEEARCDQVKINDFINKCYAEHVSLFFVPDIPFSDSQVGSMAQAIADRAKELTLKFAEEELRPEIYNLSFHQIKKAAE